MQSPFHTKLQKITEWVKLHIYFANTHLRLYLWSEAAFQQTLQKLRSSQLPKKKCCYLISFLCVWGEGCTKKGTLFAFKLMDTVPECIYAPLRGIF